MLGYGKAAQGVTRVVEVSPPAQQRKEEKIDLRLTFVVSLIEKVEFSKCKLCKKKDLCVSNSSMYVYVRTASSDLLRHLNVDISGRPLFLDNSTVHLGIVHGPGAELLPYLCHSHVLIPDRKGFK